MVVLAAMIAAACNSTSGSEAAPESTTPGCRQPAPAPTPTRSSHADVSLRSSDLDRSYKQYVPASYDATLTPLVIDLHGYLSGADVQAMMSDFGAFSEHAGFIVATPQGNGPLPYWNAVPHPDLPDDVQFISDVIDDVSSRLCIDPTRVYVAGLSNGAFLTSLVACRLADKVAAVAAVAGLQMPADCSPSRPVPILAIHGTADQFVPYDGGPGPALDTLKWNAESTRAFAGLPYAPVTDTLGEWAAIDGCARPTSRRSRLPIGDGRALRRLSRRISSGALRRGRWRPHVAGQRVLEGERVGVGQDHRRCRCRPSDLGLLRRPPDAALTVTPVLSAQGGDEFLFRHR